MKSRLLVVEDEAHLAAGLKLNLELEGYDVDVASNAAAAHELLSDGHQYNAMVLDVMLPDSSGFDVCAEIRRNGNFVPVIMLTARSAAEDRVRGLEVGADDYMVKPFSLDELLARVRSLLRRQEWEQQNVAKPDLNTTISFGDAQVDFGTHDVYVGGDERKLTQLELDLLRYFSENPGRVLSRTELLEKVWKLRNYNNSRTVDNFISRLRRHFEQDPTAPRHFVSVRGAGYKFVPVP